MDDILQTVISFSLLFFEYRVIDVYNVDFPCTRLGEYILLAGVFYYSRCCSVAFGDTMITVLPIAWFVLLGLAPLSIAETNSRQSKSEEINSLQSIAMLFDGGSIHFRFEMSSGSTLETILNDIKQIGGPLRGVPEQSAADWWLWVVRERATIFLDAVKPENQTYLNMLGRYLARNRNIDHHARRELLELIAIMKDRKRAKVPYDFWTGFKKVS